MEVSPDFLRQQLDMIFSDIRPDAVKIGMVSGGPLIEVIAQALTDWKAEHIVVDPVMVATSGSALMETDAVSVAEGQAAAPGRPGHPQHPRGGGAVRADHPQPGRHGGGGQGYFSVTHGCAVLVKGGHSVSDADDLLYAGGQARWFPGKRIHNPNTHGTGCTLSSAIASNLAKGFDPRGSPSREPRPTSPALWRPCWIWGRAAALWPTLLP